MKQNVQTQILVGSVSLALCVGSTGCLMGPNFERPHTELPEAYTASFGATNASLTQAWWDEMDDPILSALIAEGLEDSLTLQQAVQRIRQSRAALQATSGNRWPDGSVSAGTSRKKTWEPDDSSGSYTAGFDATWELDVFGGVRRSVEAAEASLAAAGIELEDLRVSLAAEIASEYVGLRQKQATLAITQENLRLQEETVEIARKKEVAGMSRALDTLSMEAQLQSTLASIPTLEAEVSATIRRLELLLGKNPGALQARLADNATIPVAAPLPETVPSELLRRRPDIRVAEERYHAALAQVGVAEAAKYPHFGISANSSITSHAFTDWNAAAKGLGIGANVGWSILSIGRNRAKAEQAKAAAEESSIAYRGAVLKALHEVETAWSNLEREQAREPALQKSVEAQTRAVELSQKMYSNELAEYLEVISAQKALLSAEEASVRHRANTTLQAISLFKALGGGWEG